VYIRALFFFLFLTSKLFATSYIIDPSNIKIEKGNTFTVSVIISDTPNTVVSDCVIPYDPYFLEVLTIATGTNNIYSWLGAKTSTTTIVMWAGINPSKPPVSGSGTIATIELKAINNGITSLEFDQDNTRIIDVVPDGKEGTRTVEIPYTPYNSTVTIVPLYRFEIGNIPYSQVTGREFSLNITGFDKEGNTKTTFSGDVTLSCGSAVISPQTITFESGVWSGTVTIEQPPNGGTDTIIVSCYPLIEKSNQFFVLHDNNREAVVSTEDVTLNLSPNALGTDSIISIVTIVELPEEIPTSTLMFADIFVDINAYDQEGDLLGTESLNAPSTITISYSDIDQDGWVDGTFVHEEDLSISQYENGTWNILPSVIDKTENIVSADLPHLSLFFIGGTQSTGSISCVFSDAAYILKKGDTFTVTIIGEKRGIAYFSVEGLLGTTSMTEIEEGKYIGTRTIEGGDNTIDGTITGYLLISTITYQMDATTTLTCDTMPPGVTFIKPEQGSYIKGTITIEVTISDNISGVDSLDIYWGSYLLGTETNILWDTAGYPEETYDLLAFASDTVGNSATYTNPSITIDNTKPTPATITSVVNPEVGRSLDISWDPAHDNNLDKYIIHYGTASGIYISSLTISGAYATYTLSGLKNNIPWYIAISAYDKAGNESDLSNEESGTPTGIFTRIKIEDKDGNEIGATSISLDGTLSLYLKAYDQNNDEIDYVQGTWSIYGPGTLSSLYGTNTIFLPTSGGNVIIRADYGTYSDNTEVITVIPYASISITKDGPEKAMRESTITYTIVYENTGQATLTDVFIEDTLPNGSIQTFTIGTLTPQEEGSKTIDYYITETITSTIVNRATITATYPYGTISNSSSITTRVIGVPKITIEKEGPEIIKTGTITYKITYKNEGDETATDVVIIEVLPEKTKLEAIDSQGLTTSYYVNGEWKADFNKDATKIKWTISEIAPNHEGTVSFTVRIE